jgi:hypothetical protein
MTSSSKVQKLDPRQWAIYRRVWSLNSEERNKLDRYWREKLTGNEVYLKLTREYENFTIEFLDDLTWGEVTEASFKAALSFRINRANNLFIVLVKEDK